MSTSKKIFIIVLGSIIAGFGIATAIHAGFGSATLAVLWEGISKQVGITIGQASILVSLVMLLFILFYDRKQIHIGTIIHAIVYGVSIDFF